MKIENVRHFGPGTHEVSEHWAVSEQTWNMQTQNLHQQV